MTSPNGNVFRVTGPRWAESSGHRWIPLKRPVTRSFDVFFDLRLNELLSKQSRRRWFEIPSRSLWRHYIGTGHSKNAYSSHIVIFWHGLLQVFINFLQCYLIGTGKRYVSLNASKASLNDMGNWTAFFHCDSLHKKPTKLNKTCVYSMVYIAYRWLSAILQ